MESQLSLKIKMPRFLDIDNWNREETFLFYKSFDNPHFNITANVDVSSLTKWCKKNNKSFSLACLFYSTKVSNEIENFKYRWKGDKVVVHETIHAGSTILYEDNTFGFCYYDYQKNIDDFITNGLREIEIQKSTKVFKEKADENNLIHYSSIPWVSFTSFKHATNHLIDSSIPKIVFGKYFTLNGRVLMPVSVEVHHALMDGYHVGKYFNLLESYTS